MTKHEAPNMTITPPQTANDPKPRYPAPPEVTACLPIGAAQLKLDVPHKRRLLRGTVSVADLVVTKGVTLLLRDEDGDMVRLGVYSMIPDGTLASRIAAAKELFPLGRHITILEPFYKTWLDGGNGVRVDNPSEVLFPENLGPMDVAGLHEEGNALFRAGHTAAAALSYTRALQLHLTSGTAQGLLTSVLLNASACLVSEKTYGHALACATTVLTLDPSCIKAFFRASLALDAMGQKRSASWCMREAVSRSGLIFGSPEARQMTRKLSPAAAAAENVSWLYDAMPVVTSDVADAVSVFAEPAFADWKLARSASAAETAEHDQAVVGDLFKKQGNLHYMEGDVPEAMKRYRCALAAIQLHRKKASVLLANRAACSLRLGAEGVHEVMADSCAAIVLDYTQPKSYHRVACELMQLGALQPALDYVNAGLQHCPGHEGLHALAQRLAEKIAAAPSL